MHGNKYLKTTLTEAAWAATRTKGVYLKSKYENLVPRKGKKKALIAIGHKILCAVYHIMKDKQSYKELGYEYLMSLKKTNQINSYLTKLKALGVEVQVA